MASPSTAGQGSPGLSDGLVQVLKTRQRRALERTWAVKATGLGGDLIQSVTAAAGAACQSRSKADTRASASLQGGQRRGSKGHAGQTGHLNHLRPAGQVRADRLGR